MDGNLRNQCSFSIITYMNLYLINRLIVNVTIFPVIYLGYRIKIGLVNIFLIIRNLKAALAIFIINDFLILSITLQYKTELRSCFIRKGTASQYFLHRKSQAS